MNTFKYTCQRCGAVVGKKRRDGTFVTYEQHIELCWPNSEPDVDYVECKLCKFAGCKITQHVKKVHGMGKDEYTAAHGPVIAGSSSQRYRSTKNYDWINKAKNSGDDLAVYRQKMSASVRESIMSDPDERTRRSKLLGKLNKRDDFKERASRVAKITSTRPDILEARTRALSAWRAEHFDEFYEKCIVPFVFSDKTKQTRPEKVLRVILGKINGYEFRYAQTLKSIRFATFNVSQRKQLDFGDKKLGVYIEFDGIHHFKQSHRMSAEQFADVQSKDEILDDLIVERGLTLIRISYDQFLCKQGGIFLQDCLSRLHELLRNPTPGVHRIGDVYKTRSK